jgi:AcrR family transcriptional regulator
MVIRKQNLAPVSRPYHHGNLRESLLAAADELLARKGVQALTLREVARAAGVSHAAPYHHFAHLDELLAAVAARAFSVLAGAMAAAAGMADAREALLRIGDAYVGYARAQPAHFRLMFGPLLARKSEFPELAQAARASFMLLLQAAERHAPGEGAALALAGWSLSHGCANLLIDGALDGLPVSVDEAVARRLHELLLPPGDKAGSATRAKSA